MHIPWLRGRNIDDVSDEHGLGKDALVREMCQIQNDKVSNDCQCNIIKDVNDDYLVEDKDLIEDNVIHLGIGKPVYCKDTDK